MKSKRVIPAQVQPVVRRFRKRFLGSCIGVELADRGKNDKHQMITVMVEDDGFWHKKMSVSSFWLKEFLEELQLVEKHLENSCDKGQWGYERR